jgi:hypothetical protein
MMRGLKVGWSRDSIKPGDKIRIACAPHKTPGATACLLREIHVNGKLIALSAEQAKQMPSGGGGMTRTVLIALACFTVTPVYAQNAPPPPRPAPGPPANPRDLSGKWLRTTPFQTFGNVKGGATSFRTTLRWAASLT